jgi:hypothetical protein
MRSVDPDLGPPRAQRDLLFAHLVVHSFSTQVSTVGSYVCCLSPRSELYVVLTQSEDEDAPRHNVSCGAQFASDLEVSFVGNVRRTGGKAVKRRQKHRTRYPAVLSFGIYCEVSEVRLELRSFASCTALRNCISWFCRSTKDAIRCGDHEKGRLSRPLFGIG